MSDCGCTDGILKTVDYAPFPSMELGRQKTYIHVERCDECKVFEGDLDAAWFVSQQAKSTSRVFYYQDGETSAEDEDAGIHEFTGAYSEGLCIAYGTDPWVEIREERQ